MTLEHQGFCIAEEKFRGAIKANRILNVEGFGLAKFFEVGGKITFYIVGKGNDRISALLPEGCPGFAVLGEPFAEIAFDSVVQRNHVFILLLLKICAGSSVARSPLRWIFSQLSALITHLTHIVHEGYSDTRACPMAPILDIACFLLFVFYEIFLDALNIFVTKQFAH